MNNAKKINKRTKLALFHIFVTVNIFLEKTKRTKAMYLPDAVCTNVPLSL